MNLHRVLGGGEEYLRGYCNYNIHQRPNRAAPKTFSLAANGQFSHAS